MLKQIEVLSEEVWVKISEYQKNIQQSYLSAAETEVGYAKVKEIEASAEKLIKQLSQLSKEANVYDHELGSIIKWIEIAIKSISPFF